jgi:hypothetical protein
MLYRLGTSRINCLLVATHIARLSGLVSSSTTSRSLGERRVHIKLGA